MQVIVKMRFINLAHSNKHTIALYNWTDTETFLQSSPIERLKV
jgi:hypothetical protein